VVNRRRSFKPWARRLPAFVLRSLLVVLYAASIPISIWDSGLKELWREFLDEWRAAGDPVEDACRKCGGRRYIDVIVRGGTNMESEKLRCDACGGTGVST
jgi:hypothetical protein